MLVRRHNALVPSDMNPDLLDFLVKNGGKSRFLVGMYIPAGIEYQFFYDTGYITLTVNDEIGIRSQQRSYRRQLHLYAWEHVYIVMPSAKSLRKKNSGWIAPEAQAVLDSPNFPTAWYATEIATFVEQHRED